MVVVLCHPTLTPYLLFMPGTVAITYKKGSVFLLCGFTYKSYYRKTTQIMKRIRSNQDRNLKLSVKTHCGNNVCFCRKTELTCVCVDWRKL